MNSHCTRLAEVTGLHAEYLHADHVHLTTNIDATLASTTLVGTRFEETKVAHHNVSKEGSRAQGTLRQRSRMLQGLEVDPIIPTVLNNHIVQADIYERAAIIASATYEDSISTDGFDNQVLQVGLNGICLDDQPVRACSRRWVIDISADCQATKNDT
ncbi:MAG: hypothetical protein ACK4JB_02130 [Reyranella sp.]